MFSSIVAAALIAPGRPNPGTAGTTSEPGPRTRIWRSLQQESARAELIAGGPLIDLGTADQHKYTRGGWGTGWGASATAGGVSFALADERKVALHALAASPVREVVARVRAPARSKIAISLDGVRIGSDTIGSDWSVVRMPVAKPAPGDRRQVQLAFGRAGVAVDWVWLRTGDTAEPPVLAPRTGPLRLGERVRRALLAPTPRAYRYYLHVPPDATLRFDYGSEAATEFTVRATLADGAERELFTATAVPGRWQPAAIDLSELAGRAVRLELTTTGPRAAAGWGRAQLVVPAAAHPARAPRRHAKNVILIVLDTTRADAFAPGAAAHTPSYDAFARGATVFTNAYNNENWTLPSTATTLSGLYPFTHGAQHAGSGFSDEVVLLSEHLRDRGFRTKALVANAVVNERFGFRQGWDEWRNTARTGRSGAANVYGDAAAWLEEHAGDGRFFLYVHSMDAHTPYTPEPGYVDRYHGDRYRGWVGSTFEEPEQRAITERKRRASADDHAWIRALYHAEITYQDEHMGALLAKAAELGVLDDTIVVITNDHGEELYEHRGMGHGFTLYEEQIRSPLLVRYPPVFGEGARVSEVVEHVDLAPTVVDVLGLPPLPGADGLSMVPLVTGEPFQRPGYAVYAHRTKWRGVRVGRWKLNVSKSRGWLSLIDLQADPEERDDRRDDRVIAGRLCEIYLGEALASPNKAARSAERATRRELAPTSPELDPETRRELEALGYLD